MTSFTQFGFGRDDDFLFVLQREEEAILAKFHRPASLFGHAFVWYLETLLEKTDLEKAPPDIQRHDEICRLTMYGDHGEIARYPQGWVEYQGHWFLLSSGGGPMLDVTTATYEELRTMVAERPWAGIDLPEWFGDQSPLPDPDEPDLMIEEVIECLLCDPGKCTCSS